MSKTTSNHIISLLLFFFYFFLAFLATSDSKSTRVYHREWGPFNQSYYSIFRVFPSATINPGSMQVTQDTASNNAALSNISGRVFLNQPFDLWDSSGWVASFNSSFVINMYQLNSTDSHGDGMAFFVGPDAAPSPGSYGGYLGLTNSTADGDAANMFVAVEFDTHKQDFDPDDNHVGLDVNGVRSVKNVSLTGLGFQLVPQPSGTIIFHHVWVDYDGAAKFLRVFMTDEATDTPTKPKPIDPILTADLDISKLIAKQSYFGFSASTGTSIELNCVLRWNLTVELADANGLGTGATVGICVGAAAVAILATGFIFLAYCTRRTRSAELSDARIMGTLKNLPGHPKEFRFKELKKATDGFGERNKLGQGSFGIVYRGVLPEERMEIAVKKFSRDDMKSKDDFIAELVIINRLRHKHLVRLLGWCHKNGSLLLVYEYMPNGSLDTHIFCGPERVALAWEIRYNIIVGVASALHYLHNDFDQKVVHRDLKASNILLDSDFNARLGDFGLARAIENEKNSYTELNGVPGTMGYIAPECLHTGKAARESDIYSFGAVILEVVCGRRPSSRINGYDSLVDWVWSLHRDARILDAVDERLGNNHVTDEAERLLLLGLACSHPMADQRPKTNAILQILSGSIPVPPVPHFRPAFVYPMDVRERRLRETESTNDISLTDSGGGSGAAVIDFSADMSR